jgi:hypothetical protein
LIEGIGGKPPGRPASQVAGVPQFHQGGNILILEMAVGDHESSTFSRTVPNPVF